MKEWKKPQLIVLVRSKPEEVVLTSCKMDENGLTKGPEGHWYNYCDTSSLCGTPCDAIVST